MSLTAPTEKDVLARAVGLFHRRRFAEAASLFTDAALTSADPAIMLAEARARLLAGDLPGAGEAARRAAAREPNLVAAPLLLARIAARARNRAGTIAHLRRAASLRPGSATLHTRLASLLFEAGRTGEALAAARAALAADPDCDSAALLVAECHLARGKPTLARLAIARLARERPDHPRLRAILGNLPEPPSDVQRSLDPAPPAPEPIVAAKPRATARRSSVLDHLAVIRACMLRGLAVRAAGNPFWLPLELVRPICVVAAHWVLFAVIHKPMPGEIPIPLFVLAGFSVWFAFNYAALGAANGANHPAGATVWPGVTLTHLRLSRALWPLLVNLFFCLLATLPLRLVRDDLPTPDLPLTCLVFVTAGVGGIGYGMLAERLGAVLPAFGVVEKLISWLLFVTCGLYFVVYNTTPLIASVLLYNPLLHLIDFERHAFDPGYPIGLVDLRYPMVVAASLLLLGLAACRTVRLPPRAA